MNSKAQALEQVWAGTTVSTFGVTVNGTGPNGEPCIYTYVGYNCWGWIISSFLR